MANNTSWLQRCLESIWYDSDKKNGAARWLLMPLSYLYSVINKQQRKTQIKNRIRLPVPVIVVGNITVGGTGKTPLTLYMVAFLQKQGYKPAIITRGYGGKAKTWPQAVTADSDANLVGDEAVLMAQRAKVTVYAGANRLESIEHILANHECDIIVSDDGMQHYKLPRDMLITVIDGKRLLGNEYCLPAGPLREKKERLDESDLIVINGKSTTKNQSFNSAPFEMNLSGKMVINLSTNEEKSLTDFSDKKIQALTGIGNPQRFYSTLKNSGLEVTENSFPDHHAFQKSDLNFSDDTIIIMTEKDAVKCKALIDGSCNDKQYWYLPVSAELSDGFEDAVLEKLAIVMK